MQSDACLFCSIANDRAPSFKVYEDDLHLAFLDIYPIVRGHTLVIPKRHYDNILAMNKQEVGTLFSTVSSVAARVMNAVSADGFRLIQNNGEAAAQVVKHVHVHILPMKYGQKPFSLGRLRMTETELGEIASLIRSWE